MLRNGDDLAATNLSISLFVFFEGGNGAVPPETLQTLKRTVQRPHKVVPLVRVLSADVHF